MKVTFVLPCLDLSGGNRIVSVHARLLQEAGHHVTTVVAGPRPPGFRSSLRRWLRGLPAVPPAAGSHFDGLGLDVRTLDRWRPVTDADAPDADVVVATWWETAEWVARLAPRKGAKCYLVQHHEVFDAAHAERVRASYRLPLRKIVVAPWLAALMRDTYGDADVDLVENAIDPRQFDAPSRGRQAAPTVGVMVSSTPFKGLDVAIDALRRLDACVPGLRVVSFGHESPDGLRAAFGDRLLHVLRPTQAQIRDCYAACDAWLMSSRSEGFGLPALEAMACRTPLVSTRTGWPADAVVDGVNGRLAEVDDAAGLAEGLARVLATDEAAWRAMSRAAHDTAHALTWDRAFPRFVAALERARQGVAA